MSLTDYKRKSKKAYFLVGMISMLIPSLVAITVLLVMWHGCLERNKELEIQVNNQNKSVGYVLKEDVPAGEQISEKMLTEVSICGESNINIPSTEKKSLVGKYAKSGYDRGTLLNLQCVYEEKEYSQDMRIYEFEFIEISSQIQIGEYVDIRIVYPNGEDYIIVNHKQIVDLYALQPDMVDSQQRIRFKVTEEEILRLASAYVDMNHYPGSRIYAVSYLDQFQQTGVVNYPVNSQVFQLLGWNPNAIDYVSSEKEQMYRTTLEQNLSAYAVDNGEIVNQKVEQQKPDVDASAFFE